MGENVEEDAFTTSHQGNKAVGMLTLSVLLGIFITGLWPMKLCGFEPRKFSSPVLQGLCCLFPEHGCSLRSLSFLPSSSSFTSTLPPHWGPLRDVEYPSVEEYYLWQIGTELHRLWKELPTAGPCPPAWVPLNSR